MFVQTFDWYCLFIILHVSSLNAKMSKWMWYLFIHVKMIHSVQTLGRSTLLCSCVFMHVCECLCTCSGLIWALTSWYTTDSVRGMSLSRNDVRVSSSFRIVSTFTPRPAQRERQFMWMKSHRLIQLEQQQTTAVTKMTFYITSCLLSSTKHTLLFSIFYYIFMCCGGYWLCNVYQDVIY